jgi:kinetochore protein NDC80
MDGRQPLSSANRRVSTYNGGAMRKPGTPGGRRSTIGRMSLAPGGGDGGAFGMPSRRESTIGGRNSGPGNSGGNGSATPRKSMIGRGGHPLKKQDPRPIADKHYQKEEKENVMAFLTQTCYSGNLNAKMMRAPASSEFVGMVEHLIQPIDDLFKIEKTEEDIPFIFKLLKYPTLTGLSRNNLKAIGSPHAWPHLLAALSWLTDLMIHDEFMSDPANDLFDGLRTGMNLRFFEHTARDYHQFLQGEVDEFDNAEVELEQMFEERDSSLRGEVDDLDRQLAEAQAELAKLQAETERLPTAKQENLELKQRLAQLDEYAPKMEAHIETTESYVAKLADELSRNVAALEERYREHEELVAIIRDQEIKAIDVEKIHNEREAVSRDLKVASDEKSALERRLADQEMEVTNKLDGVQECVKDFNGKLRQMNMAPSTAKHARDVQFEVKFNPVQPAKAVEHLKSTARPELEKSKDLFCALSGQKKLELVTVQEELDRVEECCTEKGDQIAQLAKQVAVAEKEHEREKQSVRDAAQQRAGEIDNVQLEAARARKGASESVLNSKKELDAMRLKYQQVQMHLESEEEAMWADVIQVMEDLTGHKEEIAATIMKTQQHFQRKKAEFAKM